jgi:hypothetical protein
MKKAKKELHIIVSKNYSVFFYTSPPKDLLHLLKRRFGLDFEEKVVYCG